MRFFDLHCDTLYKATINNGSIIDNDYELSANKASYLDKWSQLFAIWIPDNLKGQKATELYLRCAQKFSKQSFQNENVNMYLSVENASMLNSNIDNIELLNKYNVKAVTLTWNGDNELGCGAHTNSNTGLTEFGKEVVRKLEENNIAVDLSHSSDKLFYDVLKIAKKPFFASHSNSREITNNKRNLTDDQFKIIRDIGGIVGINFHKEFLNTKSNIASIDDIVCHTEHFLNLSGENTVAIGSDFDGADMPSDIIGIKTVASIYDRFLSEFGAILTEKILFYNANQYLTNFDNKRFS